MPWGSRGFLRAYSGSKPARFDLLDDDAAWAQPIVRDCFPGMLRDGWKRLVANRERLLSIMEALPRTRGHLDVWAGNTTRRIDGTVALFDWSFTGDAAFGEDIGNQVPDGVFDLFWPAERIGELDEAVFARLPRRPAAGRMGRRSPRGAAGHDRGGVKYAWLLPADAGGGLRPGRAGLLARGRPDAKFAARGKGMIRMVELGRRGVAPGRSARTLSVTAMPL